MKSGAARRWRRFPLAVDVKQCSELVGNNRHHNTMGKKRKGTKSGFGHSPRSLCVARVTMWVTAMMKPEWSRRGKQVSSQIITNASGWTCHADSAAGHKAPLIAVCRSCWIAYAVMGWECTSSLPRQNVNRQDVLPHLRALRFCSTEWETARR